LKMDYSSERLFIQPSGRRELPDSHLHSSRGLLESVVAKHGR
jgi:hypothetical protein